MGWNDPNWLDFSDRSQRGRNEHREIAALRRGWLRPGRFFEPQEFGPFVSFKLFAASGECNELRRVAVRRVGWRRTARLCESQEHGLFVFGRSQRRTNIKAEAASKRRRASPPHPGAAGRPLTREPSYSLSPQIPARAQPKACPSSPPVSASLRLRFRSAAAVARWDFILILLTAKRVKSLFKRAGDGFFMQGQSFFARLRDSFYVGSKPK